VLCHRATIHICHYVHRVFWSDRRGALHMFGSVRPPSSPRCAPNRSADTRRARWSRRAAAIRETLPRDVGRGSGRAKPASPNGALYQTTSPQTALFEAVFMQGGTPILMRRTSKKGGAGASMVSRAGSWLRCVSRRRTHPDLHASFLIRRRAALLGSGPLHGTRRAIRPRVDRATR